MSAAKNEIVGEKVVDVASVFVAQKRLVPSGKRWTIAKVTVLCVRITSHLQLSSEVRDTLARETVLAAGWSATPEASQKVRLQPVHDDVDVLPILCVSR